MRLLLKYTGKDGESELGFLGISVSCVHMMRFQARCHGEVVLLLLFKLADEESAHTKM